MTHNKPLEPFFSACLQLKYSMWEFFQKQLCRPFQKLHLNTPVVTDGECNRSTADRKANAAPHQRPATPRWPGLLGASQQAWSPALLTHGPGAPARRNLTLLPVDSCYLRGRLSVPSWSNKNKLS